MNERKILQRLSKVPYQLDLYQVLRERAVQESADYVEEHLHSAMVFERANVLWAYAANAAKVADGLLLEFGVFKGRSINFFADAFQHETIHGFDSFEGLAEDWTGYHLPKGAFDMQGNLPDVRENVVLHKGWFDQTLPPFLSENGTDVKFCHIDCDTYESAKYVLDHIASRLVRGSIIVFDEYYSHPNWKNGEYKAWQTVCRQEGISYKYIAFARMQVAVEIL